MPRLPDDPIQRRLLAGLVALMLLVAFAALTLLWRHAPGAGMTMTRMGLLAPLDLLGIAVAMGVGGAIAREGFRGWAVVLVVLTGVASAIAAYGYAPGTVDGVAHWLLRNTALQLLLSAIVAWAAAHAGQKLAARSNRGTRVSERA